MHYEDIRKKFVRIASHPDEKSKRLWCADEAVSLGWGRINNCIGGHGSLPYDNNDRNQGTHRQEGHSRCRNKKKGRGKKKKQFTTRTSCMIRRNR